jgi:hypothetical protein
MEEKVSVETTEAQELIESYLKGFGARDLDQCMSFFADDAVIRFISGVYNTRPAIEDWHKERFAADLKILRVDSVASEGDTVKIDLLLASKRLEFFRINSLAARATIRLKDGRIADAHFGPRFTDPFEGW